MLTETIPSSTWALVAATLHPAAPESLLGRPCSLHTNGTTKPALITSHTPTSYIVESLDGENTRRVNKALARQLFPEF